MCRAEQHHSHFHYQGGLSLNQGKAASLKGLLGRPEGCLVLKHPEQEESRLHSVSLVGLGVLDILAVFHKQRSLDRQ